MLNKSNKGQVEVSFNWIYVLVAGTLILLFFVGLSVKQKTISEENMGIEVVRVMGNILTGAGAAEKTKNFIDISGLSEFTLYFACEDTIGEYGIEGRAAKMEEAITPIFSPQRIQSSKLITWSLPYQLPFKIIDMLYVTAPNIRYYVFGQNEFVEEMEEEMGVSGPSATGTSGSFGNLELLNDQADYMAINPQKNYAVRIVDVMGTLIPSAPIPDELKAWDDAKVTAVVILDNTLDFYQKSGSSWRKLNAQAIPLISVDTVNGEAKKRNSAKFAAVFSDDPDIYLCNMKKAWNRGDFVVQLYQKKAEELERYFSATDAGGVCYHAYAATSSYGADKNYPLSLETLRGALQSCLVGECRDGDQFKTVLDNLEQLNEDMNLECIPLY